MSAQPDDPRELAIEGERQLSTGRVNSLEDFLQQFPDELRQKIQAELRKRRLVAEAIDSAGADDASPNDAGNGTPAAETKVTLRPAEVKCPVCGETIRLAERPTSGLTQCNHCNADFTLVVEAEMNDESGRSIGQFQLVSLLGRGGFGSVWRAYDTKLDRYVAIKIPRRSELTETELDQFLREARAAAQLAHPNIVSVLEVGQSGNTPFIACDLIEGEPLSKALDNGALAARRAAEVCRVVAEALSVAHQSGVIHRDLKPSNILLDKAGNPHVADFGLAKRGSGEITITTDGQLLGTPAYMPPEQASGRAHQADERSDVYSLGAVFYQMLTGETSFRGTVQALIHQAIHAEPTRPRVLNRGVPVDLETICLKALEKKPEHRYQTVVELADDLRRWENNQPILARPLGPIGRLLRWSSRKPAIAALSLALVAALATGIAGVTWQWRKAESALHRAEANKQAAWKAVDEFLLEVAESDLANEPHTEQLRKQLMSKATAFYDQVASQNSSDPEVMLEAVRARTRLAAVQAEIGDQNAANAALLTALTAISDLEQHSIDQSEVKFAKAAALSTNVDVNWFAEFKFQSGELPQELLTQLDEADSLLSQLLLLNPTQNDWLRLQAEVSGKRARIYRSTFHEKAIPALEEAIASWEQLLAETPNDLRAIHGLAKLSTSLAGELWSLNRLDKSFEVASSGLKHAERAAELQPESVRQKATLADSLGLAAHVLILKQQFQEASELQGRALTILSKIADDNPLNRIYRTNLAGAYVAMGRLAESI